MNILLVISIIFSVTSISYYIYAASYAGPTSSFLWFWLFMFVGFVILSVIIVKDKKYHYIEKIPRFLKVICLIVVIVGITVFGVMEVLIIKDMRAVADSDREYVIVLGAQVRGTRITKSLRKRLDTALDYLEEHPDANVVCSGGQGRGEDLSEAEAMKNYLMEHGIAEKRIITEDKSRTTYENLKFTQQLIDKDAKIAIVTNNFHVHRAVHLAKTLGYQNVQGMAAPSDNHLLPNYMVREAIALFKEYLVR